jgi:hypothetical protein
MTAEPHRVWSIDDAVEVRVNQFLPARHNHIFNEPRYFQLHRRSDRDVYAQLVRKGTDRVLASLAFYDVGDGTFAAPRRGTFGGIGLNDTVDALSVERFFETTLDHLIAAGARCIRVKCAPLSHQPSETAVFTNVLLRHGFALADHELNYDLTVDGRPLIERMGSGNAKRLRKCLREGLVAQPIPLDDYARVYRVIEDNRLRRGFPMTMSAEQIGDMARAFPDRLHLFAVVAPATASAPSALCAAAVTIALTESILYVLYWGDAAGMETYSPIALLASSIYDFCQARGFARLDVGTSTVAGVPNHGLIQFKRNLGFVESLKLSFTWKDAEREISAATRTCPEVQA